MSEAEPLITYLATHDAPCPSCKYNLKDIQGTKCPECGEEIDLYELTRPSTKPSVRNIGLFLYVTNICGMLLIAPVCSPVLMRFIKGDYPTRSNSSYAYYEVVLPTTSAILVGPYLLLLYLLITRSHKPLTTRWAMWLLLNPVSLGVMLTLLANLTMVLAAALVWD